MKKTRSFSRSTIMILLVYSLGLILLISSPAIAAWPYIVFPNEEGITLFKGSTYNIEWGSVRVDPVDILLCREEAPGEIFCFYGIALGVANSGSYLWTVQSSLTNKSNYVISVGKVGLSVATSDYPFTISDPPPASWSLGEWGDCNVQCGGGTQTRDVFCKDLSGNVIADRYCSGTKPSSTRQCNTDPCPVVNGRKITPWLPLLLEEN